MEANNEENEIRTDLWHEMDLDRLQNQRDLILSKLGLLAQSQKTPTVLRIAEALQHALETINQLIDQSMPTNPRTSQQTKI